MKFMFSLIYREVMKLNGYQTYGDEMMKMKAEISALGNIDEKVDVAVGAATTAIQSQLESLSNRLDRSVKKLPEKNDGTAKNGGRRSPDLNQRARVDAGQRGRGMSAELDDTPLDPTDAEPPRTVLAYLSRQFAQ